MKTILLTGSTGFIGRNILTLMQERYRVHAPARAELDLCDFEAVRRYLGGVWIFKCPLKERNTK